MSDISKHPNFDVKISPKDSLLIARNMMEDATSFVLFALNKDGVSVTLHNVTEEMIPYWKEIILDIVEGF